MTGDVVPQSEMWGDVAAASFARSVRSTYGSNGDFAEIAPQLALRPVRFFCHSTDWGDEAMAMTSNVDCPSPPAPLPKRGRGEREIRCANLIVSSSIPARCSPRRL